MKKLMLVDGNSMLFRAYFATAYGRVMTSSTGLPTNAVYGFAMLFKKAIKLVEPDAILVAFDSGKKTFRHDIYKDYKAGRKQTPDDLIAQFPLVKDYLDAYGVKRLEIPSIEGDDIVGTMAKKYPDWDISILSSDRDMLQLVDPTTSVWLMKKGLSEISEVSVESLKEEMGITPKQIIDLKGLMGDSSDNIPGIAGIGEKTALKLLADYGSVENLLEHTDELKGKLKEKVENGKESAILSKELATIKTDVDLDLSVEDCLFKPNNEQLIKFFKSLDMNSLIADYETNTSTEEKTEVSMKIVDKLSDSILKDNVALHIDQSVDNFMSAQIYGFALSTEKETCYIDFDNALKDKKFVEWLKADNNKIVYDYKRLLHLADNENIEIKGCQYDVMIMSNLCDSNLNNWEKICTKYSLVEQYSVDEVYGKEDKPKLPDENLRAIFSANRSQLYLELFNQTNKQLKEYEMFELYSKIERPLSDVLYDMEKEGILVDETILNDISIKTKKDLDALQKKIYEDAGCEFNINSPKQLGEILFDKLLLPSSSKKRSTSADVLEKLKGTHPIIDSLLEYRKVTKLYSTYAEGLKKYINKDKRIHTLYNQCITQTGRLSSSDPNLQNISVRDERAKEIRKAFIADEGCTLLSSDYSQVELRMLAHMANEKGLIAAFNSGLDIHTKTAMDIFGVDKDEVDSLMRRKAKAVNFGIVYGISDFGLAEQLGIYRNEAKEYIEAYYKTYPKIKEYMNSIVDSCMENGYVKTITNRRREIPEIHDKNHMIKEFGKRAAMNAPIQGSAADLIKIAMINIKNEMIKQKVKSKMILQVHDELIFNVYDDELETMKKLVKEGMDNAMKLSVPLEVDINCGKSWWEAK